MFNDDVDTPSIMWQGDRGNALALEQSTPDVDDVVYNDTFFYSTNLVDTIYKAIKILNVELLALANAKHTEENQESVESLCSKYNNMG